jgi:hypothetical protein
MYIKKTVTELPDMPKADPAGRAIKGAGLQPLDCLLG